MKGVIISDFGGVIYPERWDLVLEGLREMRRDVTLEDFKNGFYLRWDDYKVGKVGKMDFWEGVLNHLGIDANGENVRKVSSVFKRIWWSVDDEVFRLFKSLRKKGYTLFGLTNTCYENEEKLKEDEHVRNLFKKVYMSHVTGRKKPDPEAWEYLLRENNLSPRECVYIDDKERNTRAAERLGIYSITYKNAHSLKKELKKLGFEVLLDMQHT